jgi:hypothetical protein
MRRLAVSSSRLRARRYKRARQLRAASAERRRKSAEI